MSTNKVMSSRQQLISIELIVDINLFILIEVNKLISIDLKLDMTRYIKKRSKEVKI